ncbi:MAG: helix-turn-helix domain-containing protein [Clostridia bacterium]|nr:helix-turn-helix domain-containing protein [Clostridia bacterium]
MSVYQLEIKQLVDYPRCRIYREFVQSLIADRNIRTSGGSGLFYYTVLSCYANFRTSYKRLGSINYIIFPGEWLCKIDELSSLLRVNSKRQTISILTDLQDRHLITFTILGNGSLVKFKINGWDTFNRVFEYNAPCQKDTGFFFLPISVASEIIGTRRPSEMDILLDLWLNTVYCDERVEGSMLGPVVYMRNCSGNPLVSYDYLARRWNMSKATVGRYLKKLKGLGYISLTNFSGTKGSVIYLQKYLSTMFRISDVILDKEEIAMALNINVELDDSVSNSDISVSKLNTDAVVRKVRQILTAQGFSCFECRNLRHILLKLSDCKRKDILRNDLLSLGHTRYRLLFYCGDHRRIAAFDVTVKNIFRR